MTFFDASVLPAPDSPETTTDWFTRVARTAAWALRAMP
jgi:hypothetical protein